jgi:GTP cyclohydrolase I
MILLDLVPVDHKVIGSMRSSSQNTSSDPLPKFESYVTEIFTALGMDMDSPMLKDMAQRFVRALFDTSRGFESGPRALKLLKTECQSGPACHKTHVMEGPIHFLGLCERHSFPLFGYAYVGYIAQAQIMGICKLTRLVRLLTARFTGQETIKQQIADAIETLLQPLGVAVYLETDHQCAHVQGIHKPASHAMVWRGDYSLNSALQAEFLNACGLEN